MLGKKREQTIRVLVASLNHAVPVALAGTYLERTKIEVVEAISTQVAYANLAGCSLAIIDTESLIPSPGVAPEMLARALAQSGIPVVSGRPSSQRCSVPWALWRSAEGATER